MNFSCVPHAVSVRDKSSSSDKTAEITAVPISSRATAATTGQSVICCFRLEFEPLFFCNEAAAAAIIIIVIIIIITTTTMSILPYVSPT
jgi:hypothetical protein